MVRDGLGDPPCCPERIGGPSGRTGTGRGTLEEVRGTHGEIQDGRGTLGKVWGILGEVQGTLG